MKVLISAAEASSDTHGAELLKALRSQLPEGQALRAYGIGGPKLREQGLESLFDARDLLSMGFFEIVGRLPKILKALRTVSEAAERDRPDLAVVIDYPDFHFRLARKLKALGVPVLYYIPPKVWAWRKGRIKTLRELFARILCILPFEREFFADNGLPVRYVGNPLLDELPLELDRQAARQKLGLGSEERVLVLMAGSRPSELKRHLELMLEASVRTAAKLRVKGTLGQRERLRVLVPFPATADFTRQKDRIDAWMRSRRHDIVDVRPSQGDSALSLLAADVGLIKSGTSTLEAAVLGCPHAVVYKTARVTCWIYKYLIRYKGPIGLVNLVAGWKPGKPYLAREMICCEVTPENLADEAISLWTDPSRRRAFEEARSRVQRDLSGTEGGPSAAAAREVLEFWRESCARSRSV